MEIRVLNILFIVNIINERIYKFLSENLSNFANYDYDTVCYITQVKDNESFKEKYDIYENSKISFEKENNCLLFYYSPKDKQLYLEFILLQYILVFLMNHDIFYIHGACLTIDKDINKGVLLIGDSGCGKTSLALKMINHGEFIVTDDFILLKKRGNEYAAYMNKELPHIFLENLIENFDEYKTFVSRLDYQSYKVDIPIDKKNNNVYTEFIIPKYIFYISDKYYSVCKVEKLNMHNIISYIIRNVGSLEKVSYAKYYEFALDIVEQCEKFQLQKAFGIDKNVNIIYNTVKIQCND